MPVTCMIFLAGFAFCMAGALVTPFLGVVGYFGHYLVGPERQWWTQGIRHWGIRYSFGLAAVTAVGSLVHYNKLRFGKRMFLKHEKLVLLFLGIVFLSVFMGEQTVGRYEDAPIPVDHPSIKLAKVVIFMMMVTHIVTDFKKLDRMLWVLVLGTMFLGYEAYQLPQSSFARGRLEGVGGPDFTETNGFASFCAAMLPIIAIQFLRSRWLGKTVCAIAVALTMNSIILTRSRTGMVGVFFSGVMALMLAPKRHRAKVGAALAVGAVGGFYLTDSGFLERMSTISESEENRDASAQSRLVVWKAAGRMIVDHPLGVGAGNFYQTIGRYNPALKGIDAHNTYVRCTSELGFQGLAVFLAVIIGAFRTLRRAIRETPRDLGDEMRHLELLPYGMVVSIAAVLAASLTCSFTYNEFLWLFLMLPVCWMRCVANHQADKKLAPAPEPAARKADRALFRPRRKPVV